MAIHQGCDYSFSRPSPSCLAAEGMRFAVRYTSLGPSPKNMTPAEVYALSAAGLQVVTVFQETKAHMLTDRDAGVVAAKASAAMAGACGMPPGRPHYFALDVDPNPLAVEQWSRVRAYLAGAAEVLGRDQVGVYGGHLAIERLVPEDARWGWQTSSWSAGRWSAKAVLQQYRNNVQSCGGLLDLDQALADDYGGWRVTPMQLISRAEWGARPPENRTPLARSAQKGTAVHYSGSAAEAKADHSLCAGVVRGIQRFHQDTRGWDDIAYSYLVCVHGFVFEGRGRGVRTAANGTDPGNDGYHAVCFLGGDVAGRADVTPAGRRAIRQAVEHCNAWADVHDVRPHSFFKSTECPGDELRAWIIQGLPITSAPPQEDDMPLTDKEKDELVSRTAAAVKADLVDVLRSAFGGLAPGATSDTVRGSQAYLFNQIAGQAARLQAMADQLASLAPALGDPQAQANAVLDGLAARLAPRP